MTGGLRVAGVLVLAVGLLLTAGVWLWHTAVSPAPRLPPPESPRPEDLDRLQAIYRQLFPISGSLGPQRHVRLTGRDLELALDQFLVHKRLGRARARIEGERLRLDMDLRLLPLREQRYVHVGVDLAAPDGLPVLAGMRLGGLTLPRRLADPIVRVLLTATPAARRISGLMAPIRQMHIDAAGVGLTLRWESRQVLAALDELAWAVAGVMPSQLELYRTRLAALAAQRPAPDFAVVLGELFALARERSAGSDPVGENRALLIALAEAANGRRLGLPGEGRLTGLRVEGRRDYVQHFTLSAALAAVAGEDLTDLAGLFKEVRDTSGGSGFSFRDLAADRAGSRFGARATASRESARRLQGLLAGTADSRLYLPELGDLPEFLPESVFLTRYGGVGGPGYNRLLALIEARIATLPVHR